MTMITPSYLGDTIEYSSYASNALGALPYGRPAGGREFTSDCGRLSFIFILSLSKNTIKPPHKKNFKNPYK